MKREKGLTNEELSDLSGVPKSTIDKITSGQTSNPNLETVRAIVRALGKTLDDLYDSVDIEGTIKASIAREMDAFKSIVMDVQKQKKAIQDDITLDDFEHELLLAFRDLNDVGKETSLHQVKAMSGIHPKEEPLKKGIS